MQQVCSGIVGAERTADIKRAAGTDIVAGDDERSEAASRAISKPRSARTCRRRFCKPWLERARWDLDPWRPMGPRRGNQSCPTERDHSHNRFDARKRCSTRTLVSEKLLQPTARWLWPEQLPQGPQEQDTENGCPQHDDARLEFSDLQVAALKFLLELDDSTMIRRAAGAHFGPIR